MAHTTSRLWSWAREKTTQSTTTGAYFPKGRVLWVPATLLRPTGAEFGFLSRFIAGAVHVVLDKADPPIRTTGRILNQRLPPTPLIIAAGFPSADHKALNVTVGTERSWSVRSEIETGSGGKKLVTASMRSEYSNAQELKDGGLYQVRLGSWPFFARSLLVAPIY